IGPWAVYKRAERTGYQFDADDLEDVYRITGAYATEALIHHWRVLRRLSGNVTDQQIADDIGGNLQRATSMIQMILQDLSVDDDTPGMFDRKELHRLEAALAEAAAQIESAQADVQGRLRIMQNKEASRS
ncbi:hypothetical protein JXA32_16525, partial [Candidatus Sumerlaeota bacterium]|nr:hypothetical protein [Candidatus Sumerlaeota bacterium]